jgi:thiol:disulfide interchange protein DsbG
MSKKYGLLACCAIATVLLATGGAYIGGSAAGTAAAHATMSHELPSLPSTYTKAAALGQAVRSQQSPSQAPMTPDQLKALGAYSSAPQTSALPDQAKLAAMISTITRGQGRLVSEVPGPFGLTEAVLEGTQPGQTQKVMAWVLPHMEGVMFGALLDPTGQNLSLKAVQALGIATGPTPTPTSPQAAAPDPAHLAAEMKGLGFSSVSDGHGPTYLTIIMDPNCIFCHQLWQEFHSIPDYQSKFSIQWIPVGFLKPTSAGMAAAIIQKGIGALNTDESNFDVADEIGGVTPSSNTGAISEANANTTKWQQLMAEQGQQLGTPTVIVNGKQIVVGAPTLQSLESLTSGT